MQYYNLSILLFHPNHLFRSWIAIFNHIQRIILYHLHYFVGDKFNSQGHSHAKNFSEILLEYQKIPLES